MTIKQAIQEDLQYANIKLGPWCVKQEVIGEVDRQVLADASGEWVIAPTTHPRDHHPDLNARGEALKVAAASPELLVSLLNAVDLLSPAVTDFNEIEQKAFDEAIAVIEKVGADRLIKTPMKEITQDSLREIDIKQGPWFVATGCSWRRILTETFDDQILLPSLPDNGRQKLECRDQELRLIEASPELLVALINMAVCMEAYAVDFNDLEQSVFDEAVAAVKKAGAMRLLDKILAEE